MALQNVAFVHGEHYKYTYRDYANMPDDGNRWEIIDGVPYMMAATTTIHQHVTGNVFHKFYNFTEGRRCEAIISPLDVRLPIHNEEDSEDVINVVQPDVLIYCNRFGLDEKGGRLAPDIAVEVLSPSSAEMDRVKKLKLYELAGVKEYWIVDPKKKTVEIYLHNGEIFLPKVAFNAGVVTSTVLEGFEIEASDIFAEPEWE